MSPNLFFQIKILANITELRSLIIVKQLLNSTFLYIGTFS
ncbi:hypothetical protein AC062_2151 [Pasteurellaceae bacterium NI1060]|nr:hypothetical protein AC062_2151 [Pasteurellaceae bacterium NI1060]